MSHFDVDAALVVALALQLYRTPSPPSSILLPTPPFFLPIPSGLPSIFLAVGRIPTPTSCILLQFAYVLATVFRNHPSSA